MPRTDEAEAFFHAVYSAIQEIPPGKVTSYGHIAKLVGTPQRPRQVGVCLKHLPDSPTFTHHNGNVPWQRVINSKGIISPRGHQSGAANQAQVLRAEEVTVSTGSLGELMVDFSIYGWFPKQLPSEEAAGLTAFSDGEEEDA
ncbi:DNA binding methylated-DNA--cysteine S-methyltransferase [Coleophoma crateriformis]|uniref:DNA binding methylated-DNA--cysteine S-methyltransferase n=1 Tax=Coleophoma crateriformis TaxID=565419 RepID=A0A3D8QMK5_9HELO|nr:DNA binding methylated-DNA--cysteine S-methyltransferase [Coleophoma crateriformis]